MKGEGMTATSSTAKAAGRELVLDEALHEEIGSVSRSIAERLHRPYADFEAGVRKQATLPAGAISLGLAGTAPGMVIDTGAGAVDAGLLQRLVRLPERVWGPVAGRALDGGGELLEHGLTVTPQPE